MDGQRLQYSTSELMTRARIGGRDIALLRPAGRGWRDGPALRKSSRASRCWPAGSSPPGTPAAGRTLALTGDTAVPTSVEVWAPAGIMSMTWNGRLAAVRPAADGAALTGSLPGPAPVRPPALRVWRFHRGSPEAQPGFDDSRWTLADHTTTNNPAPPVTLPVL